MSFACRPLHGFASGIILGFAKAWAQFGNTGLSASVTLNPDGSVTYAGNLAGGSPAWWAPLSGTPGNAVWMKFSLTSGSSTNVGGLVAGTVYALSSARQIGWSCSAGTSRLGQVAVNFYSDSGATVLIGTGTIDGDVDGT